jgi:16S rRNA (adenine1518-N6/adenine1519-N6)-dimethyltransferase
MNSNIRPLKKFSQNFLVNPHFKQKIVDALKISEEDVVVEIGPGLGALTQLVVDLNPAEYFVIEIDERLVTDLKNQFGERIKLINRDILEIDFKTLGTKLKILGNLPYHITSPIIFKLIDQFEYIDQAVIMIQKEVAKRITAQIRHKDYGILSVVSQAYAHIEYLFEVGRGNFYPVPDVDSAVLSYTFYRSLVGVEDELLFRKLIRGTFNYRRKMLRNSLGRIIDKSIVYSMPAQILEQRPEELSVEEFKTLANNINQFLRRGNA